MFMKRGVALALAVVLFAGQAGVPPAYADNPMGYRLLTEQEASGLPRHGGALGIDIARSRRINDAAMSFDIIEIAAVKSGSAGEQAGLHRGDQIISVNGLVFASLRAFAAYVASTSPGSRATVDYMPSGGGPGQAQRVALIVGPISADAAARSMSDTSRAGGAGAGGGGDAPAHGLSTGTKLAIGAAAIALFGCYKAGCFERKTTSP
jgi:hypothetical protein